MIQFRLIRSSIIYFVIGLIFLNLSVLPLWQKINLSPLFLCTLVFFGVYHEIKWHTLIITFLFSFYHDCLNGSLMGVSFLSSLGVYLGIQYFRVRFPDHNDLIRILCFFTCAISFVFISWMLNAIFLGILQPLYEFYMDIFMSVAAFPLTLKFLFFLIKKLLDQKIVA